MVGYKYSFIIVCKKYGNGAFFKNRQGITPGVIGLFRLIVGTSFEIDHKIPIMGASTVTTTTTATAIPTIEATS